MPRSLWLRTDEEEYKELLINGSSLQGFGDNYIVTATGTGTVISFDGSYELEYIGCDSFFLCNIQPPMYFWQYQEDIGANTLYVTFGINPHYSTCCAAYGNLLLLSGGGTTIQSFGYYPTQATGAGKFCVEIYGYGFPLLLEYSRAFDECSGLTGPPGTSFGELEVECP